MLSEPLPPLRQLRGGDEAVSLDMLQAGHQRGQRSHDTANTPQHVFCFATHMSPVTTGVIANQPRSRTRSRAQLCQNDSGSWRHSLPCGLRPLTTDGPANATLDFLQPKAQIRETASLEGQPPELEHEPPPGRAPRRRRLLLRLRLGQAAWPTSHNLHHKSRLLGTRNHLLQ